MISGFGFNLKSRSLSVINKKTVITIAVFLFYSIQGSFAAPKVKIEDYKDLINKAQNLVLQKDRPQAMSLLEQALRRENGKGPGTKEIKKSLSSLSRLFINEKAQQAFELAVSIRKPDHNQALQILNDGLSHEADNLNLLMALARLEISRAECAAAREAAKRIHKALEFDEETQLLGAQIQLCGMGVNPGKGIKKEDLKQLESMGLSSVGKEFGLYWTLLEMKKFEILKNQEMLQEKLKVLSEIDQFKHPDRLFWEWRLMAQKDIRRNHLGQKYILSCQSLSQRQQREFLVDPFLCQRVGEVELEIKKQGAGAE